MLNEVTAFLRKTDWDEVREVFDRTRERYTWGTQSGSHLRRTTRANILKAREFLSRMSHNARIVEGWAHTELKKRLNGAADFSTDQENQLREIVRIAAEFRRLSRMRRIKLTLWAALRADQWPLRQVPSIASLRNLGANGELDLIALYEEVKTAAAKLALPYGQHFHNAVLAGL
jgi:hypothetical protein